MTATQFVLMFILILVILGGAYLLYRSYKSSKLAEPQPIEYDKNGIPIIPRQERDLVDIPDFDDTLGGETVITPNRSRLHAVVEDDTGADYANNDYLNSDRVDDANYNDERLYADHAHNDDSAYDDGTLTSQTITYGPSDTDGKWQDDGYHDVEGDQEYTQVGQRIDEVNQESDLFSSLASATENIMAPVQVADEPEFNDNSPVLDQHLLAQADNDQNSPLNNAEENINITLVPKNKFDTIDGATIRALVEQYGLKYGVMNMFHRYENKDGTGILWFSMMGITTDGIAPFDLNTLTTTQYNGLVLFLSLPHPKAAQGFDSMMSVAGLIARQLDTQILDENNQPLTRQHKQYLRQRVQEYS